MARTHPTLHHCQEFSPPQSVRACWRRFLRCGAIAGRAQQVRLPSGKGQYAELSSDGPQTRRGDLFIADKNVDLQYAGMRLRADHLEYNDKTHEAAAQGHVQFDYENQHLEATEAHYNFATGAGTFSNVRGNDQDSAPAEPHGAGVGKSAVFRSARRSSGCADDVFVVHQAWITVCDQERPTWQMFAPRAKIRLNKSVALVNANFRLYKVPLIWLPYATAPAGQKIRQSGFLLPDIGNSSTKGYVFGDALLLGAGYLGRRHAGRAVLEQARFFAARRNSHAAVRKHFLSVYLLRRDRSRTSRRQRRAAIAGRPSAATGNTIPVAAGLAICRGLQPTLFADLPPGVRRRLWRRHQLRSAQRVLSKQQFSRLQPEFRRAERQEFSDHQSGDQRFAAQPSGGAIRFGGTSAVAEPAALFQLRVVYRRGASRRRKFDDRRRRCSGRSSPRR